MKKDLGHLRKSYEKHRLEESQLKENPMLLFEEWFELAENDPQIEEANAMTLSTLGADGYPKGRVVLLKGYDHRGFIFYTNYNSEKGKAIAAHPQVGLSFFWPSQQRQIHIVGQATQLDEKESDAYFQSRPRGSQLGAWVSPQSQTIQNRMVLESKLNDLEAHYDGKPIPKPTHWGGYVVAPSSIEFWQGRPNRLHDRIRFYQSDSQWHYERLAP
jgi:pyridoxamine 5'-phosphate oxidase